MALPGCFAVIVQVPAASRVTVEPDTVQYPEVRDAELTGKPEEAVALIVNGAVPST